MTTRILRSLANVRRGRCSAHRDEERNDTMAGNLFFFLRDAALNSKDHFERFNPGVGIDREKARIPRNSRRDARRAV